MFCEELFFKRIFLIPSKRMKVQERSNNIFYMFQFIKSHCCCYNAFIVTLIIIQERVSLIFCSLLAFIFIAHGFIFIARKIEFLLSEPSHTTPPPSSYSHLRFSHISILFFFSVCFLWKNIKKSFSSSFVSELSIFFGFILKRNPRCSFSMQKQKKKKSQVEGDRDREFDKIFSLLVLYFESKQQISIRISFTHFHRLMGIMCNRENFPNNLFQLEDINHDGSGIFPMNPYHLSDAKEF